MKRVLVVDGKDTSRELIRTVLGKSGYTVSEASDGREAVQAAFQIQPDLIILDLQMTTLDSFGALEKIRGDARFADLPIVALTAKRAELARLLP